MKRPPRTWFTIRKPSLLAADLVLTILAVLLSFALRLGLGSYFVAYLPAAGLMIVLALLFKPVVYYIFGLYRRDWVSASTRQLVVIIPATAVASAVVAVGITVVLALDGLQSFPRSVIAIDLLLSLVTVGGLRWEERLRSTGDAGTAADSRAQPSDVTRAGLLLRRLELCWHVGVFLLIMMAYESTLRRLTGIDYDAWDHVLLAQGVLLGTCIALGVRVFNPRRLASTATRSPWLWALVAWAFLSTIWSTNPEVTLRWSATAFLTAAYALLLHERYSFRYVLGVAGAALAIGVVGSLVAGFVIEDIAVMRTTHAGEWRGVFYHKNALGRMSALSLAVFAALSSLETGWKRWTWMGLFGLAMLTLRLAASTTAYVAVASMTAAVVVLLLLRKVAARLQGPLLALALATTALTVGVAVRQFPELILAALGRDKLLTDRILLWRFLWGNLLERPLQGYGLGGFWLAWDGPSARVWETISWHPPHAHNGYLQLGLDLGLIGLGLGLVLIGGLALRSIRGSLADADPRPWLFCTSIAVFIIVVNITTASFLEAHYLRMFFWFFFSYVYLLAAIRLDSGVPEAGPVPAE